jgi:NADPH:quinone reductase-like Zn-dependent oxidoreductase
MKAVVSRTYGPPDVLYCEDVSQQSPKDEEVLIRVRAQKAKHISGGNGERNRRSLAAFDG